MTNNDISHQLARHFPHVAYQRQPRFLNKVIRKDPAKWWFAALFAVMYFAFIRFSAQQIVIAVCITLALGVYYIIWREKTARKRIAFVLNTPIPNYLWKNEQLKALHLSPEQKILLSEGLRDFFLINLLRPRRAISMPSEQVDKLWHAFILNTAAYERYCRQAFGKTLHHIPDYAFSSRAHNARMYTYQTACQLHGINPTYANGVLPRLFAIDPTLAGTALGSSSALMLHSMLVQQYQQWYTSITGSDSSIGGYDDVDIDSQGNISCDSSDGGGDGDCGDSGGCGGCGGD